MKRALWLVPALAMFSLMGCAVRATYYSPRPHSYWDHDRGYYYNHDHDRDHHRDVDRRDWR
jgi:hypothetical protein